MLTRRNFFGLSAATVGSALTPPLFADRNATTEKIASGNWAKDKDGNPGPPNAGMTEVSMAAARRILGRRSEELRFLPLASTDGRPRYEISAENGRVTVKASSAAAAMRGLYVYLREACNAMIAWSGTHLDLPSSFPSFPTRRSTSPYRFVQYYNPCTFGYTTAFWNWERWERELDWMALHGINMPLALEGQEAIWQTVWRSLGISQMELDSSSSGPAYLPWHRMGNISHFTGPLPQGWIAEKVGLQKKILARIREFGMMPVAPAFSGFVPQGYKRLHPETETFTLLWAQDFKRSSMPRETKSFILSPNEAEAYKKIGALFIKEYKRQYGPAEYYLADSFNELNVPVREDHRYDDLARFGRTVYDGIQAGDPNGKWVMQGWLFYDDPKFWDSASVEAFLRDVPNDRMIIIDYANDHPGSTAHDPIATNQWKLHNAFFGKQWINGMVHTFGGNNNMKGNLPFYVAQPAAVLASPAKGNLSGWGMDMEGIENNEVVYELLTDIGWTSTEVDLSTWVPRYCKARYGSCPAAMGEAWNLLLNSAYHADRWNSRQAWQCRPSLEPKPVAVNSGASFQLATEKFLSCAGEFQHGNLYRNDLIEIVCQAVGGRIDRHLAAACRAHQAGDNALRNKNAEESIAMLARIDGLLNLRPDRRLETWTADARSWARSPEEAAFYDENARRLITFWGWRELEEYASRVWSGLTRDYYAQRWRLFFKQLRDPSTESMDIWEETWLSSPYRPSPPRAVPDLVVEARSMLALSQAWNDPDRAL